MTTTVKSETDAAAAQRTRGMFARVFTKAFGTMTPAERKEIIQDAAVAAGAGDLIKSAQEMMSGKESDHVEQITDLWDGDPDMMPKHKRVAGHSGNHAGDTIITGPGQSASGDGAVKMAKEYSEPASQGGVAEATNRLGEMLSMKAAMKAVLKALEGQSRQSELLTSAVVALVDDVASVKASIAKAIRKAEETASEKEEEKDEEEEADEEAKESESESDNPFETAKEADEEDEPESDEDKEKAKTAAKSRVLAKSRLRLARGRLTKALDAELDGKAKSAARHRGVAKAHAVRAQELFVTAKAARPQAIGRLAALHKAIQAIGKALPAAESKNQDKFPASTEKPAGGGETKKAASVETVAAAVGGAVMPDLTALASTVKSMQEQFEEANRGLGMFKTTIAGVMNSISGQSRTGNGQPPHLVLAKGGKDVATSEASVREKISQLHAAGAINDRDVDTAEDVLGQVIAISKGFPLDARIVKARIDRMPEPADGNAP